MATRPAAAPAPAPAYTAAPTLTARKISPPAARPVLFRRPYWRELTSLAAGMVLASGLLLSLPSSQHATALDDEIVADHIRAMQASHLLDIVSTDQHNVKPWFEGKVDYAPPVKNLADHNFPLLGGRLDYVAGRTVAVTIFQRGKHPINLYAWPDTAVDAAPQFSTRDGYNLAHWQQAGMTLWAISDANMKELQDFVGTWQSH